MSNLVEHAKSEFKLLGWPGECEVQKAICKNIIDILEVFYEAGHSGTSAPYTINLIKELAMFNPISPLTGEDSEWIEVRPNNHEDGPLYQNKRDCEVFKNKEGAYWIQGKVFMDDGGFTYTNIKSRVPVEFPWTKPEPEIVRA